MLGEKGRDTIYATFDPKSGDQRLTMNCVKLAQRITTVRPARELPAGSKLQLITGLRGRVDRIEIQRGLMKPTEGSTPSSCGYSGSRMDE